MRCLIVDVWRVMPSLFYIKNQTSHIKHPYDFGLYRPKCEDLRAALSENVDHIFSRGANFYGLIDVVTEIVDSS